HVERVLQQSGVAMIIFRRHEDEPVATPDCCCELRVFHLLAGIELHRMSAYVDQLRFHTGTLLRLFEYQMRDVFALSPRRAVPRITVIKSGRSISLDRIYKI